MKSKVSLIVPVYNVENYLPKCLESATHQSLKEIICINNGSIDKSGKILEKYAKQDERIYLINQENQGLSNARNSGFSKASGEFVSFLDSDDTMSLDALKKMYQHAKNTSSLLVIGDYKKINLNKSENIYASELKIKPINAYLNGFIRVPACGKLYQKKMLDNHGFSFEDGIYHKDELSTLMSLHFAKDRVSILNEVVYRRLLVKNMHKIWFL